MNTARFAFLSSIVLSTSAGCVYFSPPHEPAQPSARAINEQLVSKEDHDALRKQEKLAYAQWDGKQDEQIGRMEKDALKALRVARSTRRSGSSRSPA